MFKSNDCDSAFVQNQDFSYYICSHNQKKNISSLTAGLKRFEICSSGTELNWT